MKKNPMRKVISKGFTGVGIVRRRMKG